MNTAHNTKLYRYALRIAANDYLLLKKAGIEKTENGSDSVIGSWLHEAKTMIDTEAALDAEREERT